jgi:hypothetical protein
MAAALWIGMLSFGLVTLTIILLASLASVNFNHAGLNYSKYFKSVENKTYEQGFHFISLGHEFIQYDLTL